MPEINPYLPPQSRPDRPTRRPPWSIALRVAAVIAGFSLVADPTLVRTLPDRRPVQITARVAGSFLLLVAFVPWRRGQVKINHDNLLSEDL